MGPSTFNTSGTVSAESAGVPESLAVIALGGCGGFVAFDMNCHVTEVIEVENVFVCRV